MEKGKDKSQDAGKDEPYRVRLPEFITDEQVGLGDVVKRKPTPPASSPAVAAGAVPPP
jgi:hypothetical protein